jgi:CRP-like cAMP-binding protein
LAKVKLKSNRVLANLSSSDTDLLAAHLEPVTLELRQKLEIPNKPISHIYFVENGIVSVVATGPRRQSIEVGVIGLEGYTGWPVIMGGDRSPLETFVQVAGHGQRIASDDLRRLMSQSPTLVTALQAHVQVFITQISQTALANGLAKIEERLARWLLMAQDRMRSNELSVTHEFLSMMLAVRRPGVTVALSLLQSRGLLNIKRGQILIIDREGLEKVAAKYYGVAEKESDRLLGRAEVLAID